MIGDLQDGANRAEDRLGRETFNSLYMANIPGTRLADDPAIGSRSKALWCRRVSGSDRVVGH
jgi:hypothetical protein